MIYSGSVVFIEPDRFEEAVQLLESFEEIDVHGVSEDKKQIVISVETENDSALEELSGKLKSCEAVLDIGHHIMHFEEDVEAIINGGKIPDLKGFHRSGRREKHPLEEA